MSGKKRKTENTTGSEDAASTVVDLTAATRLRENIAKLKGDIGRLRNARVLLKDDIAKLEEERLEIVSALLVKDASDLLRENIAKHASDLLQENIAKLCASERGQAHAAERCTTSARSDF